MPVNVNGTPDDSQIQGPLSREAGSAAALIRQMIQPVANKIEFIRSYVNQTRDAILGLTRPHVIGINLDCGSATTHWTKRFDGESGRVAWVDLGELPISGNQQLQFEITPYLPDAGKIIELGGEFVAASGHSALPADAAKPRIEIRRVLRGASTAIIGNQYLNIADTAATLAAYESVHPIAIAADLTFNTVPYAPIDTSQYRYYIRVFGEQGSSYKEGFTVNGLYVKVIL